MVIDEKAGVERIYRKVKAAGHAAAVLDDDIIYRSGIPHLLRTSHRHQPVNPDGNRFSPTNAVNMKTRATRTTPGQGFPG